MSALEASLFALLERGAEGEWRAEVAFGGEQVAVLLDFDPLLERRKRAARSYRLWRQNAVRLKRRVCQRLLARAQREFAHRHPLEPDLSLARLEALMCQTHLTLEVDGSSSGWYADGGAVFGPHHFVIAELDASGRITDVGVHGGAL